MRADLIEQGRDWHTTVCRVAPGRGTEPRDAAERGRHANGAFGVLGYAKGRHAVGNRCRGASATPARDSGRIVRITYRAVRMIVAGVAVGELVQIRLAEHDRASLAQRAHERRVFL